MGKAKNIYLNGGMPLASGVSNDPVISGVINLTGEDAGPPDLENEY